MSDDKPTNVVVNGRILTPGMAWWNEHSSMEKSQLFCVHNIQLTKPCPKCKEGTVHDSDSSS